MAGYRVIIWLLGLGWLLLSFFWGSRFALAYLVTQTFLPLPIVLVGQRLGQRAALLMVVDVLAIILALNPTLPKLLKHLSFGELLFLGLVLTYLLHRFTPAAAIAWAVALLTLVMVMFFLAQALHQGVTPLDLWGQKSREIADTVIKLMGSAGVNSNSLKLLGLSPVDWHTIIVQLLPSLMIINTALVAWLNVALARQGEAFLGAGPPTPPLWQWSAPERFIFVFLAAGFLLLAPVKIVRLVSLNLLLICAFVYFLQGVAVIAALFDRFKIHKILRLMGYLLIFFNPMFIVVLILGLMDLWLDFRRLQVPQNG